MTDVCHHTLVLLHLSLHLDITPYTHWQNMWIYETYVFQNIKDDHLNYTEILPLHEDTFLDYSINKTVNFDLIKYAFTLKSLYDILKHLM